MKVRNVFLSLNARDFSSQSAWWSRVLGRGWDRQPMPSCHEWDLTESVFFQVLDSDEGGKTVVTLLVDDLDGQVARLRGLGLDIPEPTLVEGFNTLRYCRFHDPEGNEVGLLDGE